MGVGTPAASGWDAMHRLWHLKAGEGLILDKTCDLHHTKSGVRADPSAALKVTIVGGGADLAFQVGAVGRHWSALVAVRRPE